MKAIYLLSAALLILCVSCNNAEEAAKQATAATDRPVVVKTTDSISLVAEPEIFTLANIQRYADSVSVYYRKALGNKHFQYKVTVDSVVSGKGTSYYYFFRMKGENPKSVDLSVFKMKNDSLATDLFNDLKTQELVLGFGINKQLNDITVNGNYVIWHNLPHPIAHRIKDHKRIFREVLNFHPSAPNCDSLAGFSYCGCHNEPADQKYVQGKWKVKSVIKNWQPKSIFPYFDDAPKDTSENLGIIIVSGDSLCIDGSWHAVRHKSSTKLPDSWYYFRYYITDYLPEKDALLAKDTILNKHYYKEEKRLASLHCEMITYNFDIWTGNYLQLLWFANGEVWAYRGDNFYKLGKAS
jgi:hypothetical protein